MRKLIKKITKLPPHIRAVLFAIIGIAFTISGVVAFSNGNLGFALIMLSGALSFFEPFDPRYSQQKYLSIAEAMDFEKANPRPASFVVTRLLAMILLISGIIVLYL